MKKLALLLFLLVPAAFSQPVNPSMYYVATAPSGSCVAGSIAQLVITPGTLYTCQSGTWASISGSGTFTTLSQDATSTATGGTTEVVGLLTHALPSLTTGYLNWTGSAWALSTVSGGGVTSFSAGNLSPLFTTSVATATSTPALTFSLSTAAANTVFGNFTGSTAAPTFTAAPAFSAANLTSFPTFNQNTTGSAGSVANALTMNNGGSGAASGATFNGSASTTLSYNTLGAAPLASPTFTGTVTIPTGLTLSGVTGSTQCLNVNSSGIVSGTGSACGSGGGSTAWSGITNPSTNLALTMGSDTSTFTYGATTGSSDLYKLTDTASNTGTGIMFHATTASSSTEVPFQADANGVGWQVTDAGVFQSTGGTASGSIAVGTDGSGAGTLQLSNSAASAHTIWGSAATTSNTIAGFATAPTTGDLVDCTTSSTTCTLTDSGVLASNVTTASGTLTSGDVVIGGGSKAVSVDANAALSAGALSLGASGTAGSVVLGNATSGTLTVQPATGAITSYAIDLPVAQPSGSNTYLSCTAANPAVCTWAAGGGGGSFPNGSTGQGVYFSGTNTGAATSAFTVTSASAGGATGFNNTTPVAQNDYVGTESHLGIGTVNTTLNGSITATSTSLTLTSGTGWPAGGGYAMIQATGAAAPEFICFSAVSGTTMTIGGGNCGNPVTTSGRSYWTSTAATHASGVNIYLIENVEQSTDAALPASFFMNNTHFVGPTLSTHTLQYEGAGTGGAIFGGGSGVAPTYFVAGIVPGDYQNASIASQTNGITISSGANGSPMWNSLPSVLGSNTSIVSTTPVTTGVNVTIGGTASSHVRCVVPYTTSTTSNVVWSVNTASAPTRIDAFTIDYPGATTASPFNLATPISTATTTTISNTDTANTVTEGRFEADFIINNNVTSSVMTIYAQISAGTLTILRSGFCEFQ